MKHLRATLLLITMLLCVTIVYAQSGGDKLFNQGLELQKVMTISSQDQAIAKFKAAKKLYDSEEKKAQCDRAIQVSIGIKKALKPDNPPAPPRPRDTHDTRDNDNGNPRGGNGSGQSNQPHQPRNNSNNSQTQVQNPPASSGGASIETFTVNGVSFEMVRVDGGTFMMGSDNGYSSEQPVHAETVATFYIGKTEVTQALWEAVMGSNPSYFKGANLPVEQVSWNDCMEFIERLNRITGRNFRLPTEAEWEYAARGGNKSRGYTYSGSNNLQSVGWYGDNSSSCTHPVGTKLDNELGLYDMSGNVWEWTSDLWSDDYNSYRNGGSSGSNRVLRGGGWSSSATGCRSAHRNCLSPASRNSDLGFRLAL